MKFFLLLLLLVTTTITHGQWLILEEDGPANTGTEPDARPQGQQFGSTWCNRDDVYTYTPSTHRIWKWEGETDRWIWQPDPPATFLPRSHAAYWTVGGQFWIYGGRDAQGVDMSDLWSYHVSERRWTQHMTSGPNPGPRSGTAFWTHLPTNRLYLYGGTKGKDDCWSLDISGSGNLSWTPVTMSAGEGPGPREGAVAVLGRSEDVVFLFGGLNGDAHPVPKLRQLSLDTMTWSLSPTEKEHVGPAARTGHTMWKSATDNQIYLFGGRQGSEIYGDFWLYDVMKQQWVQQPEAGAPNARYGSSFCTSAEGYMYLFGGTFGEDSTVQHNDLWKYGPFTPGNILQLIDWKLDSATLAATATLALTIVILVLLLIFSIVICCNTCRKRKQGQGHLIPISDIPGEGGRHDNPFQFRAEDSSAPDDLL